MQGVGANTREPVVVDESLIVLQLRLTQAEVGSLLMAQITQARHHRARHGEASPITRLDCAVLEKLVSAQRRWQDVR